MFQVSPLVSSESVSKADFDNILAEIEESMGSSFVETCMQHMDEWDMTACYKPTRAFVWNYPELSGQICRIICKDTMLALVAFTTIAHPKLELSAFIYRLEDLRKVEN